MPLLAAKLHSSTRLDFPLKSYGERCDQERAKLRAFSPHEPIQRLPGHGKMCPLSLR